MRQTLCLHYSLIAALIINALIGGIPARGSTPLINSIDRTVGSSLQNSSGAIAEAKKQVPKEYLSIQLKQKWVPAHTAEFPDGSYIMEMVQPGDNINNWTELLTIHAYPLQKFVPLGKRLKRLQEIREKECPGSTQWHVIQQQERSILYEWQAKPCLGLTDQHEIAVMLDGQNTFFLARYTVKTYQMPSEKRAEWIKLLSEAEVME